MQVSNQSFRSHVVVWAVAMFGIALAFVGRAQDQPPAGGLIDPAAVIEAPRVSLADSLQHLGELYHNEDDPILQQFWLLGRYHAQAHWSEGSNGEDESFENRRLRAGFQAKLFHKLTVHAQMTGGPDLKPFYNGFTELWAQWEVSPELAVTVGQQNHRFTYDRNVSSRYINYLERSLLTNQFRLDYTPAITISGKSGNVNYYTGIFTNHSNQDIWESFTEINSGYSWIGSMTCDLGDRFNTETAFVNVSALHSEINENATKLNRFDDGVSAALILTQGAAALVTEVTGGIGGDRGSAAGLNLQPSVFLSDQLQLALRYQISGSKEEFGLSPQRRYEEPAGLPAGDLYQAGYLGLNYYLARHQCKLMAGIEYATMGGEDVWTASTMFRFYFGPDGRGPFPISQTLHGAGHEFLKDD